jgi:hypothetical protein
MSQPEPEKARQGEARAPWERPTLTVIGHVRDLVQGGDKVSGNADSDLGSPRKPAGFG